jgi:S-adenosylmethionine:tRNA ribosyltransferase-isomerase
MDRLRQYSYTLPQELIAQEALSKRDDARLFVYDTKTDRVTYTTVAHLDEYLPAGSVVVCNNTKVIPARVTLFKETGGKVELLFLMNEYEVGKDIPCISDRRLEVGQVLAREGYIFRVTKQVEARFYLSPEFSHTDIQVFLETFGTTPLPPYIKGNTQSEDILRERYQTVFAEHAGSVAAPTASLHLTPEVFKRCAEKSIERVEVTLHVGLGTFAPISEENFLRRELHTEPLEIRPEAISVISRAKRDGRAVVAIGTTTTRVLESQAQSIVQAEGSLVRGATSIFIYPPYEFKVVDALFTNFHVPESSLMCLVDAFLGHKGAQRGLLELYELAIQEKFRFYSFGDAILIL